MASILDVDSLDTMYGNVEAQAVRDIQREARKSYTNRMYELADRGMLDAPAASEYAKDIESKIMDSINSLVPTLRLQAAKDRFGVEQFRTGVAQQNRALDIGTLLERENALEGRRRFDLSSEFNRERAVKDDYYKDIMLQIEQAKAEAAKKVTRRKQAQIITDGDMILKPPRRNLTL
jgi:hypothetical protein